MPSFDIVSELEIFEVNHAVQNTQKEIATRFDFRGQDVSIEINEKAKEIKISTESDFQCEQVYSMLENHFFKRKVDIQALDPQKMTASDTAKKINKAIKESGVKVQSSIQGDKIRVTDKKRDTLQQVMAFLKEQQFGVPLQFNNFKD
ncbi:hypothetical protein FQR65_LT16892 [Abscondita terminalis]|nr:hypothetical protein FQR65_LT16892 [Abscondita terminalis]